ncbi:hypothetical protein Nepgr_023306 [Nepenthes gracilis]|uniref:Uncharacterized protein n=1 Tax=Nepenthes gracilis TaxID=150966 RepID=A0AAD3XYX2_NEPGR|nr:hypothetical protein Nepgr_023306 [Nepenthes gracilis]
MLTPQFVVLPKNIAPKMPNLAVFMIQFKNLEALIYSGNHDLTVPHVGTQDWINLLNLTIDINWRPWFLNGEVAGYMIKELGILLKSISAANHSRCSKAGFIGDEMIMSD